MKFTNGFWLTREGYEINHTYDVREIDIKDDKVILYAPCKKINRRGDTLNTSNLTIELSTPKDDIVRIRTVHHKGSIINHPRFDLKENKNHFIIKKSKESISLKTGETNININYSPLKISFTTNSGEELTSINNKGLSWIQGPSKESYMRGQMNLGVGELIYGLGERFSPFIKNGQSIDLWNEDGGTSSEQAYKNIPFYFSNKGYGIFINHPEKVSLEVGMEAVSKTQFSVKGEELDFYLINGKDSKEVFTNYTDLTGKPALPPSWSYGLWLTTSFTTEYDEATVNHFVDGMAQRDIPLSVFHFDCFWMKEFEWTSFEWDLNAFPNPNRMLDKLKKKGLKISIWINPYIAEKSVLFDEAAGNNYLLKRKDGTVWQWDLWQAGMGIVDFTNPEACKWYKDKLRALINMGVDSFKTDFGERIPTDVIYYNQADPYKMHNYYSYLYNKIVFEVLEEEKGKDEAVLFARSATAGGQKFPVHWGGDCDATYESMAESLRGGLSLALSGFGYWSHDIGGFESTSTPDLFKRWTAFGLLSTHSRFHGSTSYKVPWLYDEEAVDVTRFFSKVKNRLMPYLYSESIKNHEKGIPVMRPLLIDFSKDKTTHFIDKQYMLGSSIMVAPIFNEEGLAEYYLPEGKWTHFLTKEIKEGGKWYEEKYDYMSLPFFVKENSLLVTGAYEGVTEYAYADNSTFTLYQLQDGMKTKAEVTNQFGEIKGVIEIERSGNEFDIQCDMKDISYEIVLNDYYSINSHTKGELNQTEDGKVKLSLYDSQKLKVTI